MKNSGGFATKWIWWNQDSFFFCPRSCYKALLLKTCLTPNTSPPSPGELCHILYIAYGIYCMQLFHLTLNTANGTILNATWECDLLPNILIEHILDTPTQHKWNPVQSAFYILQKTGVENGEIACWMRLPFAWAQAQCQRILGAGL